MNTVVKANDSLVELRSEFEKELVGLINTYCIENESDTPDFILTEYIMGCLDNYAKTTRARDKWFDFTP
jgi:hypothetical protein